MASITVANAVVTMSIETIATTPVQIQGFAQDDVFDVPQIKSVEELMGVDGFLSFGFVYVPIPWTFSLQADSASNDFFDMWWTQMQAAQDVYVASGQIVLPGIATKINMSRGGLTMYKPAPDAKKLLQPRKFQVTWNGVGPAPQ